MPDQPAPAPERSGTALRVRPSADTPEPDYGEQIALAATTERWGLADLAAGILVAHLATTIIGSIIISIAGWDPLSKVPMWGFGVLQVPLWAVYLGTVVYAGTKGTGAVHAFGVRFHALDPIVGLVVGVLCQLIVLPLLYIPIFRLTGTDSGELSRPAEELASRAQSSVGWILFALLIGLVAPVIEELFFRGLLLRSLSKRSMQIPLAVLTSAAIFAAMHLQALQFPGLFVFGVVLAVMAVASGRLGPSIFAHIGFNATTIVVLYLNHHP